LFNLIITIISIGLFAIVLMAGHSYVNLDQIYAIKEANKINSALIKISTANSSYQMIYDRVASNLSELIPSFTAEPLLPKGLVWDSLSFNAITGESILCFGGVVNTPVYLALKNLQKDIGNNQFVIGSSCGDSDDLSAPEFFPFPVMVTYKIR
jgi:hypothetical protein